MSKYILVGLFFLMVVSPTVVSAQTKEVFGYVKESLSGDPLIGANVYIKGTTNGVATDRNGKFSLKFNHPLPFTLVISGIGFAKRELIINANTETIAVALTPSILSVDEVVFTASRVEESIMRSPVAVEKLTIRDLRESPAPNLFEAMEAVKGVQMTTVSQGFKVPNTRGFNNTTNPRFLSMVDGADTQAPGLGVSISNAIGPNELDIESIEIVPGATSALYGMNALNGTSNMITKSPFLYQGFSFYQQSGVNHVDGYDFSPQLTNETAMRYAKAINDRFAFKVNVSHLKGTDWVVQDWRDLSPNANISTGLIGEYNPGLDPLNSYGNENQNRRILDLNDGKRYDVRRTGYFEKDLINKDYTFKNLKADASVHYKLNPEAELSYTYRVGLTDAIYQRGNRIRLEDYLIQHHKLMLRTKNLIMKGYYTSENTQNSYNLRPLAENLDKAHLPDDEWFDIYMDAFNRNHDAGYDARVSHRRARSMADEGRLEPGTERFDEKFNQLIRINDWDRGAQLILEHQFYHFEWQYDFRDLIQSVDIMVGSDYRDYVIQPEGNSFINPITQNPNVSFNYSKLGGFIQATKRVWDEKLKIMASARIDQAQYFSMRFNPRFALVYSIDDNQHLRVSAQNGYRFPTLFEGFSAVNNGGVIRYGGTEIMTGGQRLFENSYLGTSVDRFQQAVLSDINQGVDREDAIVRNGSLLVKNEYTYLVPEEIKAFDIGYKSSMLDNRLYIDLDFYYNIYNNFIDQVEIAVPNQGTIVPHPVEADPTWFLMEDINTYTQYRMWTNSKSTYHNYGYSAQLSYNMMKKVLLTGNYSRARLHKLEDRDVGLETSFNTPEHIINLGVSDRELFPHVGYSIGWRWQSSFTWIAPLASGMVPAYNTLNAQVTFQLPTVFSGFIKIGGTNLLNNRYKQYVGGPEIGGYYYVSLSFGDL